MDGFKNFLNASLQRKLSVTLSAVIIGVALVAGIFSFLSAYNEAYELQDDVLRQVAALMDRQHLSPDILASRGSREGNEESRVIVQRLGDERQSSLTVDNGGPLPLPKTLPNGLQTLRAGGETFRVIVRTTTTGEQIAVAQETGFRNQIARASALRTVMPFLVLVPILLIAIPDLVRKMFRRVALLAREIDQRAEQELHPVEDSHIPAEVLPFVGPINRLLARVAKSTEAQRRFVADAAHELRTPLTALSLQAELVSQTEMSDAAREGLGLLRTGIERGRNLLNQLLTFARTQSFAESPKSPVSVQGVYRRVASLLTGVATLGAGFFTVPPFAGAISPLTDLRYWLAMGIGGVFGTVFGDLVSHTIGMFPALIALGVGLIAVVLAKGALAPASMLGYWCIVLAERAAGTPTGDWFASRRGLGLGLPVALLCVGAGLIAALWLYQGTKRSA